MRSFRRSFLPPVSDWPALSWKALINGRAAWLVLFASVALTMLGIYSINVATSLEQKGWEALPDAAFKQAMPRIPNAYEQLDQLLGSQITLGMLADIVAYTIDLGLETKVQLLAESHVLRRARLLLEAIAARPPSRPRRPFPPDFSAN